MTSEVKLQLRKLLLDLSEVRSEIICMMADVKPEEVWEWIEKREDPDGFLSFDWRDLKEALMEDGK